MGERSNVKKSVVGRHCVIGRNVKILGCVIMDFVTIGDGYVPFIFVGTRDSILILFLSSVHVQSETRKLCAFSEMHRRG